MSLLYVILLVAQVGVGVGLTALASQLTGEPRRIAIVLAVVVYVVAVVAIFAWWSEVPA